VLASLLLALFAQADAPASHIEYQTHAAAEYWMIARSAASGDAPGGLILEAEKAVEIMVAAQAIDPAGSQMWARFDGLFATADSMAEVEAVLERLYSEERFANELPRARIETLRRVVVLLRESEASFRAGSWLEREERLEKLAGRLDAWWGDRQAPAIAALFDGLGVADPGGVIPVTLVTVMPAPGAVTVRTLSGAHALVGLADAAGDLETLPVLAEKVMHEALHVCDARTRGHGSMMDALRASVQSRKDQLGPRVLRDLPHAWIFAHTSAVMREIGGVREADAERKRVFTRLGQNAEHLAKFWPRVRSGAMARSAFLAAIEKRLDQPRRPNLLLILADDQGWADFSHLGMKDDVRTPRLDELAAAGVSMSQCYATSPICNPSRVGLITGRYQQRWGNYYYGGGRGLPAEAITLAERLSEAGYATGYFGKVHTGGPDNGPDKPGFPLNQGFDRFFGTTCGGRVHYLYHSREAQARYGKAAGQMEVEPMWDQDQQIEWEGFTTVDWTTQAIDFIEEQRDRPWFAFVNYNAVHNFAWQLPAEELAARDLEEFPDWDSEAIGYREWYKGVHRRDWPEGRAYYLAQLECLDREVGRLLDRIDDLGQTENTLVIYTVDNGGCVPDWADNGPLAGSKYHLLEGGTRVRSFVKLPHVLQAGKQHAPVVSCLDFAPSICELLSIPVEAGAFDGVSQVDAWKSGNSDTAQRALHWDIGWQWSVRYGDWKLMVTVNEQRAQSSANFEQVGVRGGVHLYHLGKDPSETTNLAERRPEIVEMLRERHIAWRASLALTE